MVAHTKSVADLVREDKATGSSLSQRAFTFTAKSEPQDSQPSFFFATKYEQIQDNAHSCREIVLIAIKVFAAARRKCLYADGGFSCRRRTKARDRRETTL